MPVLVFGVLATGETGAIAELQTLSSSMCCLIALSGMFGCSLSVCYMALNQLVSATSMVIAGNLNKLLASVIGAYVFSNVITMHTVVGLLVCIYGGYLYSQAGKKKSEPEAQAEVDGLNCEIEEGVESVIESVDSVIEAVMLGDSEEVKDD